MKFRHLLCLIALAVTVSCGNSNTDTTATTNDIVEKTSAEDKDNLTSKDKTDALETNTPKSSEQIDSKDKEDSKKEETSDKPEETEKDKTATATPTSNETTKPTQTPAPSEAVKPTQVPTATPSETAKSTQAPTPVVTATPKPAEQKSSGSVSASDLVFNSGSGSIKLGDSADKVEKALGTGYTTSEVVSCINDGTDKIYMYSDVEVYTYEKSPGNSAVYEVTVTSGKYPTNKGIKVGDAKENVISTYGSGYKEEGKTLSYNVNDSSIQFFISGDKVQSISYLLFN